MTRTLLVAVSVALAAVATGLLAGGMVVAGGSAWFYGSIGASALAAVTLLGAARQAPSPAPPEDVDDDHWLRPEL